MALFNFTVLSKGILLTYYEIRLSNISFFLSPVFFSETRCSRNKSEIWNSNIYLTKSSDTIYSPDYNSQNTYPANMSCTWLISLPKNKIQLSFSAFDLQAPGNSCQHGDFVEVRDGEYPDSPVLGTFCGSNIPSDTFSSGSYMLVQFRSDKSMEKRGFVTSYCSYDTSNGRFKKTKNGSSDPPKLATSDPQGALPEKFGGPASHAKPLPYL